MGDDSTMEPEVPRRVGATVEPRVSRRRSVTMPGLAVAALVGAGLGLVLAALPGPRVPLEYFDQCKSGTAPDAACYASRRDPASANVALATEIAHRYIAEHPVAELSRGGSEGVLMYAMTELYRVTGDPVVHDYYEAYVDRLDEEGYRASTAEEASLVLAALALHEETGDVRYEALVVDAMSFLFERAPRTDEGGISHLGTQQQEATLWVDSLFMFGMVLARRGELRPDPRALDEMGRQLASFGERLQDPEDGLFMHAYNWTAVQDPEVYWARGNAWAFQGTTEYLRVRRVRGETDERAERVLEEHMAGILATQDDSGGWWTVMNRPGETYRETSATGLFGHGLARAYRYGLAGDEALEPIAAAVDYVRSTIVRDSMGRPIVTGISRPTTVGGFDTYANVPVRQDLGHGVGAAILILIESSGLPR